MIESSNEVMLKQSLRNFQYRPEERFTIYPTPSGQSWGISSTIPNNRKPVPQNL